MIFASKPNKYLILALSRLVTLVWKIRLPSGGTRPVVAAWDIRGVSGEFGGGSSAATPTNSPENPPIRPGVAFDPKPFRDHFPSVLTVGAKVAPVLAVPAPSPLLLLLLQQ